VLVDVGGGLVELTQGDVEGVRGGADVVDRLGRVVKLMALNTSWIVAI
jgi:hypothetical protein